MAAVVQRAATHFRYRAEVSRTFFYCDDNRGRGSITQKMDQEQAREAARKLARAEFEEFVIVNRLRLVLRIGALRTGLGDQPWPPACGHAQRSLICPQVGLFVWCVQCWTDQNREKVEVGLRNSGS
jgi:hypothetical protein